MQIGEWGELYWSDAAEITLLNGEKEPCNYDISAEFAYHNSVPVNKHRLMTMSRPKNA